MGEECSRELHRLEGRIKHNLSWIIQTAAIYSSLNAFAEALNERTSPHSMTATHWRETRQPRLGFTVGGYGVGGAGAGAAWLFPEFTIFRAAA